MSSQEVCQPNDIADELRHQYVDVVHLERSGISGRWVFPAQLNSHGTRPLRVRLAWQSPDITTQQPVSSGSPTSLYTKFILSHILALRYKNINANMFVSCHSRHGHIQISYWIRQIIRNRPFTAVSKVLNKCQICLCQNYNYPLLKNSFAQEWIVGHIPTWDVHNWLWGFVEFWLWVFVEFQLIKIHDHCSSMLWRMEAVWLTN